MYVLDEYRKRRDDRPIQADLLSLDADLSPSWRSLRKIHPEYAERYHEVRLYNLDALSVNYAIDTNLGPPVEEAARDDRLVIHGGGWGIGTYRDFVAQIAAAGYATDLVCYRHAEVDLQTKSSRLLMDDPAWRTWHRDNGGRHMFPPFSQVTVSAPTTFQPQTQCNGLHRIIRQARAVVSKPGAGTLIDSLAAATPIILLEPFGPHEEANARVWIANQFGFGFQSWAQAGFPREWLIAAHQHLMAARERIRDYSESFLERFPLQ